MVTSEDHTIANLNEGDSFLLTRVITHEDVDTFARLSGDRSPLHTDDAFAQERGFERRVVHGMLLASFFSELLGMHLPVRESLLLSTSLKFRAPAFPGDTVRVVATVDRVSDGAEAVSFGIVITNEATGATLLTGKAMLGFMKRIPESSQKKDRE